MDNKLQESETPIKDEFSIGDIQDKKKRSSRKKDQEEDDSGIDPKSIVNLTLYYADFKKIKNYIKTVERNRELARSKYTPKYQSIGPRENTGVSFINVSIGEPIGSCPLNN